MTKLTQGQRNALEAASVLAPDLFARRQDLAQIASGRSAGFPLKTMQVLWQNRLVEPESIDIARASLSGQCTCGADRWRITDAGRRVVEQWGVRV